MKNKFIIFYTVFAAAIFTFSIAFFGVNIYKEYSQGHARVNQRYNKLIEDLSLYNSVDRQISQTSLENIKNIIGDFNDFSFIQINLDNSEILKYPKDASAELTVSNLTKTFNTSLQTQNGQINILCNIYILRPSSIYYYAKISFFIILIVTIITIILIFYLNSLENHTISEKEEIYTDLEYEDIPEIEPKIEEEPQITSQTNDNADLNLQETEESAVSETASVTLETPNATSGTQSDKNDEIQQTSDEKLQKEDEQIQEIEQTKSDLTDSPDVHEQEKVELPDFESPVEIQSADIPENPTGLFNPLTGFGWESYLETRLENEINRAISSEIDLTVFLFQLPAINSNSEEMKKVCDYLTLQFQFKDLLFEYEENCLVAIKISMNLDEALNFADKIHCELSEMLDNTPCYIGISTRSIRMVTAERLLHEARAALEHAKEDESSPIIAFRVDAEKYRHYLEQNQ